MCVRKRERQKERKTEREKERDTQSFRYAVSLFASSAFLRESLCMCERERETHTETETETETATEKYVKREWERDNLCMSVGVCVCV